jgi:pimeloyl-ACP methyl ester carboxylesterase
MKLHSNIIGEGKPFLFLHGFLGMGDNWKTLAKQFSEDGYQVHLIDQRNHGRSPHSEAFSYELLSEDLKEYCNLHNLDSSILLGHSMGGKTAMLAASNYPELFEKLIIVDIAPKFYPQHHQSILKGLSSLDFNTIKSRGAADKKLSEYVPEIGVRQFLLKNLYWVEKGKLALRMNLHSLVNNIEEVGQALPEDNQYKKPALFIKGDQSDYIKAGDASLIANHFPNAKIETINNSGHWVHAESPDEFYVKIMNFI